MIIRLKKKSCTGTKSRKSSQEFTYTKLMCQNLHLLLFTDENRGFLQIKGSAGIMKAYSKGYKWKQVDNNPSSTLKHPMTVLTHFQHRNERTQKEQEQTGGSTSKMGKELWQHSPNLSRNYWQRMLKEAFQWLQGVRHPQWVTKGKANVSAMDTVQKCYGSSFSPK